MKPLFSIRPPMIVLALALGACVGPYSAETIANANNVPGLNTGPSVLSTTSDSVASVNGNTIPLPYVIYAPQNSAATPDKKYGIEFLDFDPCTWGTQHGWKTVPNSAFNQLGFYFLSEPTPGTYKVKSGGGDKTIDPASGALGVAFVASPTTLDGQSTFVCKASQWLGLTSGSLTIDTFDSAAGTMTGSLNLVLNDGSTITGNFQSGSCSATSQYVTEQDTANACTKEE